MRYFQHKLDVRSPKLKQIMNTWPKMFIIVIVTIDLSEKIARKRDVDISSPLKELRPP